MTGGTQSIDQITITLRSEQGQTKDLYIDVFDTSLSAKWLTALNNLLINDYHLEKNYCWLGWPESARTSQYLCDQINASIAVINNSDIGYRIDTEPFSVTNTVSATQGINQQKMNQLHQWFEDLQGWAHGISSYYNKADARTRWHIRQLNLLCHEFESLILSLRKVKTAPDWRRPSQLMCWLNAPRYELDHKDFELFGIDSINRDLGGVFVGVNKAVGKHHWEVFNDEGKDARIGELTTSALRSQTLATGDFDIEWGSNPAKFDWQIKKLEEFRTWLCTNGFDPEDPSLTIGHPKVGQVDLVRSFGTDNPHQIWQILSQSLDVYKIQTSRAQAIYDYRWSDSDYHHKQMEILKCHG